MSGGRVIHRDFILKESQQALLKIMIERFFQKNHMRSARNHFQSRTIRQIVQAAVYQRRRITVCMGIKAENVFFYCPLIVQMPAYS